MSSCRSSDLSDMGLRTRLQRPVWLNSGPVIAEGTMRLVLEPGSLRDEFAATTGVPVEERDLPLRVFAFDVRRGDEVVVRTAGQGLPLVIRRNGEVFLNFDVHATRAVQVADSKRPIYTYLPGFNVQKVPVAVRRRVSNVLKSLRAPKNGDVVRDSTRLPLTSFEYLMLLVNRILSPDSGDDRPLFRWPAGKRAVFVALHDVDTAGFLRRRDRDPLFQVEQRHDVRSTWFVPTIQLGAGRATADFLLDAGHEIGWHGYNHDHRLPFRPFAARRVEILKRSCLGEARNYPTGMRTPRLLKTQHLFELLERDCPALCYDTSILQGVAPYYLWLNGRESNILEIPTTVPTDILVYNQLSGVPRAKRAATILEAQVSRARRLIEVGGVISIVTHPEKDLSERPDFLDVYDQFLTYIKSQPDVWFTTAGELFKYWTGRDAAGPS